MNPNHLLYEIEKMTDQVLILAYLFFQYLGQPNNKEL